MSESDSEYEVKTAIPLKRSTRDEILKPFKIGDETYDSLLRRAFAQYEPPEPPKPSELEA